MAYILGKRKQANDEYEYRIRWLGYESEDDTWEPMENLTGCGAEINVFNKRKQVRLLKEQKLKKRHILCRACQDCIIKGCNSQQLQSRCDYHLALQRLNYQKRTLKKKKQSRQTRAQETDLEQRTAMLQCQRKTNESSSTCKYYLCTLDSESGRQFCELHLSVNKLRQRKSRLPKADTSGRDAIQAEIDNICKPTTDWRKTNESSSTCKYYLCTLDSESGRQFCELHLSVNKLRQRKSRLPKADTSGRDAIQAEIDNICKPTTDWRRVTANPHVEYQEGFLEAQDSRPNNEFVVDSGSSEPNRPMYFKCCGCDVTKRKLQLEEEGWVVYEKGPSNHNNHTIAKRRHYPWSADQKAVLDREISKGLHFTAEYLFKMLENAGVAHDCTIEDVVIRCQTSRKQLV